MKAEKDNYYNRKIMGILLDGKTVTYGVLSKETGMSERSVRSKVAELGKLLEEEDLGSIQKKPHVGIWLSADSERKGKLKERFPEVRAGRTAENTGRTEAILRLLFGMEKSKPMTLSQLADRLYLSIPTAKAGFENAVRWFAERNIRISTVKNRGICVDADEGDYRLAFRKFILEKYNQDPDESMKAFFGRMDFERIRRILIDVEERWHLEFGDYSFREICVCLTIAVYRMQRGFYLQQIPQDELSEITKHKEYDFAADLSDILSEEYHIEIPAMETASLAGVILCANIVSDQTGETGTVLDYDAKLKEFVKEIIVSMSVILEEDLTEDPILYNGLLQHVRPAIFRLRYGYEIKDEMIGYVKSTYKQVYRAVWSVMPLFEQYFDVKVTDVELTYIALYVQVALERKAKAFKAVLITQANNSYSQLLAMKIQKAIPRITDLMTVRRQDLKKKDLSDYRVAFSTVNDLPEGKNIIYVPVVLDDEAELRMKLQVKTIMENIDISEEHLAVACYSLLSPKFMLIQSDLTDKTEILREMTQRLLEEGCVKASYFESVLEREKSTTTSIGNGVAIPHGYSSGVKQSRVCICTLKKPVLWNDEMVDVIFLLAVRMRSSRELKDLQLFYKYFIKLTETDEKVNRLRKIPSGAEMYKFLIS
jgi:activator of the mannose operon (transcriptional antiterminator)